MLTMFEALSLTPGCNSRDFGKVWSELPRITLLRGRPISRYHDLASYPVLLPALRVLGRHTTRGGAHGHARDTRRTGSGYEANHVLSLLDHNTET